MANGGQGKDYRTYNASRLDTVAGVDEEEKARGELAGYYDQVLEGYVRSRPVVSTRAAELLRWSAMESREDGLNELLRGVGSPEWRRAYVRHNKLVVDSSTGVSAVVSRVPVTMDPIGARDPVAAAAALSDIGAVRRAKGPGREDMPKVPRYALAQVLDDVDLQLKWSLTPEFLQLVARQAVVDVGMACATVQRVVAARGFRVVVHPGGYGKSLKNARATLLQAAEGTVGAPGVVDVVVIGESAICRGGKIVAGVHTWTATGPVWRTHEVVAVARLASVKGSVVVNQLFENQMLVCGIVLLQEVSTENPVSGIIPCAGPLMEGATGTQGFMLPLCVQEAAKRVVPILSGECVTGTAVVVSPGSSVVNWHVVESHAAEQGGITLGAADGRVVASMVHGVGYDLWLVSHEALALSFSPWLRRVARPGETARLVYAGLAAVEFSDQVSIRLVEGGSVITTLARQVRGGISGAALVAESDGAFLGVLHGHTYDRCVFSVLKGEPELGTDSEIVRREVVSNDSSDGLYEMFADRGLERVVQSVSEAIEPLYSPSSVGESSKHVASAVCLPSGLLSTTLNPELYKLVDSMSSPYGFSAAGDDRYTTVDGVFLRRGAPLVRAVHPGEEVCIMGKDADGAYFSQVMAVSRVDAGRARFWLDGVPFGSFVFSGGVVVAVSDAAVVGQFVMREGELSLSRCVSLLDGLESRGTSPSVLAVQTTYPMLHPAAWDVASLDGVLALDPVVLAQYTDVGRASLRAAIMLRLVRQRDDGKLAAVQACLDNPKWVMGLAVDSGFVHMYNSVVIGDGVRITKGKVVDVFFALIGMAAVFETDKTFGSFVDGIDAIDSVMPFGRSFESSPREYSPVVSDRRPASWLVATAGRVEQ